jgi:hypothetical protein
MKDAPTTQTTRTTRATRAYAPGTYLRCAACGRLLKIEWATRSIVCACGARVSPDPPAGK